MARNSVTGAFPHQWTEARTGHRIDYWPRTRTTTVGHVRSKVVGLMMAVSAGRAPVQQLPVS
jgi:hypothetical protein